MKINLLAAIILVLSSIQLFSQNNQCNCVDNLKILIGKTEENYAGFPIKVNEHTKAAYQTLIKTLQSKASGTNNAKSCFYLLKNYIRFFGDKHFILSYSNDQDYDNETVTYSDTYFKTAQSDKQLNDIEGIWINPDSTLKLAIQKFPGNVYKAIVLESTNPKETPGLVYMTLTGTGNDFIAKGYKSFITTDVPARQKGNLLQIWNHDFFGKIYPNQFTQKEKEELNTWKNNNKGLDFKKLSSKTAYLKITSFLNNDSQIQQLVSKNDSIIRNTENLIVDLTGNGGGNTGWIAFFPYFMTNPVFQADSYVRVSPANIKSKLADLEPFATNPIPDEYKKYFPENTLAAYKKAYEELPKTTSTFYPIPGVTFPLDSVTKNPKKIALIVDNFCGSSTEYFFFISKQSKKTTTYGINTIGMMDYEGMSNPTPMPYDKYFLTIPIVKSSWTDKHPIDKTGFKPDKLLTNIPQTDWIEYVRNDLEQK